MAENKGRKAHAHLRRAVCLCAFFPLALYSNAAFADSVRGAMEFDYTAGSSTSTAPGAYTKSTSDTFRQRYRLSIDKNLYPNLRWSAGCTVEKAASRVKTDGADSESTTTRFAPATDLVLSTPFVSAGAGFNKSEATQTSGGSSMTAIRDVYFANLGLRPAELPALNVSFQRSNTYDRDRTGTDRTSDILSLSSRYTRGGLNLGYQGNYTSSADNLTNLRVNTELHSGKATYATQLLKNRVSLSTSYDASQFTTEVSNVGRGEVTSQAFPTAGLAGIDVAPATAADDTLAAAPALIDNIANTGPTTSNFDIGFLDGLDTRTRNFGVDFGVGNDTELNTLYVYVSDAVNISSVAGYYAWEVYVSADSDDPFALHHWTRQPLTEVSFNPFDRRFELKFPNVRARLIKVVTRPLPVAAPQAGNIAFKHVFVTEVQTLIRKPASEVEKKSVQTSQTYNLSARTRLLNSPLLFHDLYYFFAETSPGSGSRRILNNGLSVAHTFNRVFSGSMRVALEENSDPGGTRVAYVTSASLRAVPLKTLSHNLTFSSRDEDTDGKKSSSVSLFLNNLLEVYRGVNLVLSEGTSSSTATTGQKTDSTVLTYGANIVPNRTLSASLYFSDTQTRQSGGEQASGESSTQRSDLSLTYRPFAMLYLSYGYSVLKMSAREASTLQSYGITWSPFPDGALQFNVAYGESLQSDTGGKTSALSPSIRWRLGSWAVLNLSYLASKSESGGQSSEAESLNANLSITF